MPSNFLPTPQLQSWLNLLIGPVLTIASFVIIPYMICAAPGHKLVTPRILLPLLAIWPNILGGPLEEEFGWQGYLLPRMAARFGNSWASVIVGVIWASWHLPLIVSNVWAGVSFWLYLPQITALAVFASLAYFATGRSILGPIIVHYVFNTCSTMIGVAFNGQPLYRDRYRNADEIIVGCMIGVALLTIAATRGKVGESQSSQKVDIDVSTRLAGD
jgi:membrane protease YdiL (CAAX protease family)